MDGELKAILITAAIFIAAGLASQIFYPGGVMALLGIFGK